jgi:dihydrofolate reductase
MGHSILFRYLKKGVNSMGKVILFMAMSLDGFINDRKGEVHSLYPMLGELRETELLQKMIKTTGAVMMGRHSYEMAEGDFTDYEFSSSNIYTFE